MREGIWRHCCRAATAPESLINLRFLHRPDEFYRSAYAPVLENWTGLAVIGRPIALVHGGLVSGEGPEGQLDRQLNTALGVLML